MSEDVASAKLDELIDVNRETQQWLKILAWEQAGSVVEGTLEEDAEYHLYEKLDGETSIGNIIDEVSIPRRTVYNRLEEWQRVGIISKVSRGKYDKIASLESLDIEIPKLDEDE